MARKRYAMATEGRQFSGDGFSLSWPWGGTRDVIEVDEKELSPRMRAMLGAETPQIVEVEDEPTKEARPEMPHRLMTGAEAKEHMAIPPVPVVIQRHQRVARADIETRSVTLVEPEEEDAAEPDVPTVKVVQPRTPRRRAKRK